ncbi:hypothetical protein LTR91_003507 [Friedmanniomyces endolithicus]|uniref:Uncharacterized protein n=1 Tax=Friedmanniomyces endolithicus TaxID=329885 RepID=A0AAN6QYQ5_9PEZI|nr:hypothetical protein LTR94_001709 [Friedmanniomyces endolithicus]KAK0779932.1 hypothetical protein LTR38_014255 [Friedmanniomyces endolithicus]KAK0808022.1 hypothetical protein LTR59_003081 [Friedmanniomyces endolithicus]KAK0820779.1 hypothetical protein LTR75_001365 [Friedmanniomyces endolithicus]KAK0873518.1 hypothetical protein LTS02_000690 [Friedmanniomyces endolithicus]
MPWWLFVRNKRRRTPTSTDDRATTAPAPPPIPRQPSRRGKRPFPKEKVAETQSNISKQGQQYREEQKSPPPARRGSIEDDITALPYTEARSSRPPTLRSRISGTPSRMRSGKRAKGDHVREEEIRAMSQPVSVSKRPGEGPLRKDSKKMRGLGARGSYVSLPRGESIHSSMSAVLEQRGWEVGYMDVFNPRPAVRLSGTPQYVVSGSAPGTAHASPDTMRRDKEKRPVTRESLRKRDTIGAQAESFDASDLRMLMERDKKRKERRDVERHEKLDRKLRNRSGRNRGDSDKKRRDADEKREEDEAKSRIEEERRREAEVRRHADEEHARAVIMPPTDVHPALRDAQALPEAEVVGLGIDPNQAASPVDSEHSRGPALLTTAELGEENTGTYLQYDKQEDTPTDPFADPLPSPTPELERLPSARDSFAPSEKPVEHPVLHIAKEVRVLQSPTPPLSPVRAERVPSSLSRVATPDFPDPPSLPSERRISEPKDRRAGAWASFFRRGGPNLRRSGEEGTSMPSDTSFSNVSRESMRNQPLPAHLFDASALPSQRRKSSGAPVRTQSKFREDLPGMPISPSDARLSYPDVTQGAALAAAARRQKGSSKPVDVSESRAETPDPATINRTDTPVSPSVRGNRLMSASLASMDSEGSWLASSGKRQSSQSALSRSIGSLSKRKPEFSASYEELGGDKDAEYFQRTVPGSAQHAGTSALAEASPDEESSHLGAGAAEPSAPGDPLTVQGSARRQPTLVHRDPRLKSREALLTEYSPTGAEPGDSPTSKYEFDLGETPPETPIRSARSVDYGRAHARQVSAGSARLLDIPASKRQSVGMATPSPAGSVPPVSRTSQL